MEVSLYDAQFEGLISSIVDTSDLQDCIEKLKQIKALKVMLDTVDRFHSEAVKYATLEATALVKVCELGGENRLKGYQQKTARWLYSLSDAERQKYIDMCADGFTIEQVWKREVGDKDKIVSSLNKLDGERQYILETVKERGIIKIDTKNIEPLKNLNKSIASDWMDGTRRALRDVGAIGVGDKEGTYVMKSSGYTEEIRKAISTRWESVLNDVESIIKICKAADILIPYQEFEPRIQQACREKGRGYIIHFIIGLLRAGVCSGESDFYENVTKTELNDELHFVSSKYSVSRDDYIRNLYNSLEVQVQ